MAGGEHLGGCLAAGGRVIPAPVRKEWGNAGENGFENGGCDGVGENMGWPSDGVRCLFDRNVG
jgi:hypothetical protein